MTKSKENIIQEINNFSEVPIFENEAEEADFWSHHALGDDLLESMATFELDDNIEQEILTKLRLLPTDKQKEVLDFTEFLFQKQS